MSFASMPVACSWSGGKDSCFALWQAVRAGARPVCLVTMFTEDGDRSRSHGLARSVLEAQAVSLGLPLLARSATWDDYETAMVDLLAEARERGAEASIFGDIDIERHRAWEEMVCQRAGLRAELPLWQHDRWDLLEAWWEAGFEARVVVARDGVVSREILGQVLDRPLAERIAAMGADPCGENGEFHTLVTAGPLFRQSLEIALGEQILRSGCWFQDVAIASQPAPT